jgi:hypothetical protein
VGNPWVGKWAKIFCAPVGLHIANGVALSWQFRGTATTACNRSDLREFRTEAVIAESPWLGTDNNSFWSGRGVAAGVAVAHCRIVPF